MLVHPQFDPIAIQLGPLAIHWYGLTYLVAFGLFLWLATLRTRQPQYAQAGWNRREVEDLLFWGVLGVIIGGRLGYVLFYKPGYYAAHLLEVVMVWKGGMSFHGGLLGVIGALALHARQRGRPFLEVMDLIAPCVPLGLASGRVGNFINGELWGRAADPSLPWAMVFPQSGSLIARHPSQLYQVALEGVLLFVVAVVVRAPAARTGSGIGCIPDRLRLAALHRRILPRARSFSRPAGAGPEHGPVAVCADGAGGRADLAARTSRSLRVNRDATGLSRH